MAPAPFRKAELILGIAWLLLMAFGAQVMGPVIIGLGLGGLACYLLWRKVLPGLGRRRRARRPLRNDFQILPPGERYGPRAPATLAQLARALEDAAIGQVELSAGNVIVRLRSGDRAEVTAPEQGAVVGNVRVKATSLELAAVCCDALAPRLGPMRFSGGGIELFIDGTRPRTELEEDVRKLEVARARALRDQLDAVQSPARRTSTKQYLN